MWIGFGGDLATRLAAGAGFDMEGEIRDVSFAKHFRKFFADTVSDILGRGKDWVYSTAARIPSLIAALAEEQNMKADETSHKELVHHAQSHIAEHAAQVVDFAALAESLGVPYRTLRYLFAKETGSSMHRYQLDIRLARAKNLLRSTEMPIAEIAETLGFNSTWYFAHFFQNRAHISPAAYRKHLHRPAAVNSQERLGDATCL